jgi:tRNA-uridine 2-sulfurtransferase
VEGGRVIAALSGGVDSGCAAARLLDRGLEVIGVTLRLWACGEGADPDAGARSCCGLDGLDAARATAAVLGIPHYVLDVREAFERLVLRPSWGDYARGRTPNPCVLCNEAIKFGLLLERATALGATHVATGHYARLEARPDGTTALLRGIDRRKDQSYFLFAVPSEVLARALFPLGALTKAEVRAEARRRGLPSAERRESQDACLGGAGVPFAEALRARLREAARPGEIVDDSDSVIGRHDGIHLFTLGQRRALGVALGRRAFVRAIDAASARVFVTTDPARTTSSELLVERTRWLVPAPPAARPLAAQVQIRYRSAPAPAQIAAASGSTARVRFESPQRAVTPGQAAVFYDGERLLGGGVIAGGTP